VASYGQIASLISTPRAARIVGYAMRYAPSDVPWQRVISGSGRISIENIQHPAEEQARLLEQEGIVVQRRAHAFFVDIKKFGWKPK
jgi:methylated-DNA-protein-cysteine methyltransferase-like protein